MAVSTLEAELVFEACEREAADQTFRGVACDIRNDGHELYHHTDLPVAESIVKGGAFIPSKDPHKDGVVNFTVSPDFHRFGSVRFVLDRSKVKTTPMCYVTDGESNKLSKVADKIADERRKDDLAGGNLWRIQSELGVEPESAYLNECKHFSREPVSVKAVKKVEYWAPWKPEKNYGETIGSNVSPCVASWDSWSTGMPGDAAIQYVKSQAQGAKNLADTLGVPFEAKSCYAYAQIERNGIVPLDDDNLRRLTSGEELRIDSVYDSPLVKRDADGHRTTPDCLCPKEHISRGDRV